MKLREDGGLLRCCKRTLFYAAMNAAVPLPDRLVCPTCHGELVFRDEHWQFDWLSPVLRQNRADMREQTKARRALLRKVLDDALPPS